MNAPFFSILLPAYNAGKYISQTLEDLLKQTFCDFEIVLVDDGSTDDTREIVARFSDSRIRLTRLPRNEGLVGALNVGLKEARGSWIVRQDADDRCRKDRLARQHEAILANPAAILHYSWAKLINKHGWRRGILRPPTSDLALRWDLCFRNAIPHSSVVFLTKLVRDDLGGYRGDNVTADYDLWSRLLRKGTAMGCSTCLVSYRNHSASVMGRENTSAIPASKQGLWDIMTKNLCEWSRASEEEAEVIATSWQTPANANWKDYFKIREALTSRGLAPNSHMISEEDYTLMHLAFGVSKECGIAMLNALRNFSRERYEYLPQPRTWLSRFLMSVR